MINRALRFRRQSAGLTQRQMADASQMDLQTYSKKERGVRRTTDTEACRFARILGCRIEDIVSPGCGLPTLEMDKPWQRSKEQM